LRASALKPKSISGLERSLKRDFKNVYTDVMFLAGLGLLELREEGKRKTLVPVVRFTGIEVDLRQGAAA
jgi:predicted transcriptional regulator